MPRGDEKKSYREILDQEIRTGLKELRRPTRGLLLSGFAAGLEIGFSALAVGLVMAQTQDVTPIARELVRANAYAVGFVAVIFGRSELFTEHTTLALLPVLDRDAPLWQLGRLWGLVYVGNLIGGAAVAAMLAALGPAMGTIPESTLGAVAAELADHGWWVIVLSAVLAGWMMGLVTWLVSAGRDTIGQVAFTWILTATIGFGHLHHSIVASVELFAAEFAGAGVGGLELLRVIGLSTLGNAIGGTLFVGVVKYAHATVPPKGE